MLTVKPNDIKICFSVLPKIKLNKMFGKDHNQKSSMWDWHGENISSLLSSLASPWK
jgi:hypothetical protein